MKRTLKVLAAVSLGGLLFLGLLIAYAILNGEPLRRPTGKVPMEFRILADRRHDEAAAARALSPSGLAHPPPRFRWAGVDPHSDLDSDPNAVLRDREDGGGKLVLVRLDRQNVTESHIANVYPTTDESLRPAIGFTMNREGSKRFGDLTRSHLPERDGAFKYRLAIILGDSVISAPSINSEIRDQGIIEGGGPGFTAAEVDRLIAQMTR